ncbi:MAG: heme-binding domain-containing protein [Acidobacteriota bacterium]|nr:heme-binding domain-containing protein [Acidobacteriota bacterium]
MKRLRRTLRWVIIVLACGFAVIQFFRPAKTNPPLNPSQSMDSQLHVSPQAAAIFDRSCNDCHSHKTRWPWYSNIAPVSWFVIGHVNDGRAAMNLSEWGHLDPDRQARKLQQMCDQVQDGIMPLSSYTPLHPGSKLSSDDVKILCDWTNAERARITAQ